MKSKSEILKMSKKELQNYNWDDDLDIKEKDDTNSICFNYSNCSDCYNCSICSDCYNCYNCSICSYCYNCLYCRNLKNERNGYWICNVEVSKEEFEAKKKELGL
ncbi:MAG: hypothetical protein KKD48_04390 [Nanoarchaeota archaeon]|nr:hypothetical protein [Nanoarchaeota archaeon]